jgi:hypothetical protein
MISNKIDYTRRGGEEIILNAGKEASEMIKKSEREGKRLPRNILKNSHPLPVEGIASRGIVSI